jgi:thymidylate synthase (FAD)
MVKIVEQSFEILSEIDNDRILRDIELAARTCYKSEDKISGDSHIKLVSKLIELNHSAMLEHAVLRVKFITNRGVTHELVRHRMASYAQESTRYCNYSKNKFGSEISVIKPVWTDEKPKLKKIWLKAMQNAEKSYMEMTENGALAQEARELLPIDTKTEIVVTANIREWRHIFALRCSKKAHPQIRKVMIDLREELKKKIPILFDDLK